MRKHRKRQIGGGSSIGGMGHMDNVHSLQNIGNLSIMGEVLLIPQGVSNLAGSGGISQFAMSTLHPHISGCMQLSS
eukprot:43840-Ditylum_brightwellii.AAC.1